ncbi:hypothetical protein TNCV_3412721 [Trichonephila clavipes]|uniref:Uncharacterized protein n=1 Tax=Trichonephila clavipes TaxID=2585209 RepID=A0A8X6RK92_TRICX|nr:hypothetical protein TNCV_3412721 [Trichonephila clavipes]
MADSWKARGGLITGYLLLGPRDFEKCGVHSVETIYRERYSGLPTWARLQKGNNAGSRLLFERDRWPISRRLVVQTHLTVNNKNSSSMMLKAPVLNRR